MQVDKIYCGSVNYSATAMQGDQIFHGSTVDSQTISVDGLTSKEDTFVQVEIIDSAGNSASSRSEMFKTPQIGRRLVY